MVNDEEAHSNPSLSDTQRERDSRSFAPSVRAFRYCHRRRRCCYHQRNQLYAQHTYTSRRLTVIALELHIASFAFQLKSNNWVNGFLTRPAANPLRIYQKWQIPLFSSLFVFLFGNISFIKEFAARSHWRWNDLAPMFHAIPFHIEFINKSPRNALSHWVKQIVCAVWSVKITRWSVYWRAS